MKACGIVANARAGWVVSAGCRPVSSGSGWSSGDQVGRAARVPYFVGNVYPNIVFGWRSRWPAR